MSPALVRETYVAERFDTLEARFRDVVGTTDVRLCAIEHALAPLEGRAILDLGCGKGRFARHLQALGGRVVGLDRSPRMLAGAGGLPRVLATARRLPFAPGVFDAVVAIETLQHVDPIEPVLAEVSRVLRPGGILAIIDRNAMALDARRPAIPALAIKRLDQCRGRWMYPMEAPVREHWFHPERLASMLDAHFEHVELSYLLRPEEAVWAIFRQWPRARSMVLWTAHAREGLDA